MPAHDTADARTALMATYLARYPHPLAGKRSTPQFSSSRPLRQYDANISHGHLQQKEKSSSTEAFGARGRTIYNADMKPKWVMSTEAKDQPFLEPYSALTELQRIDAEQERKRALGYEFSMEAKGDSEMPVQKGPSYDWEDEQRVQEMFELYIHMDD